MKSTRGSELPARSYAKLRDLNLPDPLHQELHSYANPGFFSADSSSGSHAKLPALKHAHSNLLQAPKACVDFRNALNHKASI